MSLFTTRRSNAAATCLRLLIVFVIASVWAACGPTEVDIQPTSLQLGSHEMTLAFPDSVRLSYELLPEEATGEVAWKSSDPSVLTVDRRGYVRTVSVGSATVTATCGDLSDQCTITVKPYLETIRFTGAALAGDPDTTYYGGTIIDATMNGKPVKVYKSLMTLHVMSEGLYLDADGQLTGSPRGAIITIKAPIYYGPKSLNDGKSVGNIVDKYSLANPYADEIHTFAMGTVAEEAYLGALAERFACRSKGQTTQERQWADSAAHCFAGATLSLVNYRSTRDGAASDGYEINVIPIALVEEGAFTLTNKGVTSMMYGLKSSRFVVRPFDTKSEDGAMIGADGYTLLDQNLHFGEPITYTY